MFLSWIHGFPYDWLFLWVIFKASSFNTDVLVFYVFLDILLCFSYGLFGSLGEKVVFKVQVVGGLAEKKMIKMEPLGSGLFHL